MVCGATVGETNAKVVRLAEATAMVEAEGMATVAVVELISLSPKADEALAHCQWQKTSFKML